MNSKSTVISVFTKMKFLSCFKAINPKKPAESYEKQYPPAIFVIYLPHDINSTHQFLWNFLNLIVDPNFSKKVMKKFLLCLTVLALTAALLSSCAATKRDCQGNKHYRLKNGIYL